MSGRVLVVGLERKVLKKIDPLLSRSQLSVDCVAKGDSGMLLAAKTRFDLLVVRHPLPDMSVGSFMSAVHEPGSPCASTPVLFLTDSYRLEELRPLLPGGAGQALSVDEPDKLLQEIASRQLGVSARVTVRVPVRLEVTVEGNTSRVACQAENISAEGLLLRSPTLYPIGTRLGFEYTLPDQRVPVAGEAEVVRHAVPEAEGIQGVGLRVIKYKGGGATILQRFLKGR
jgi:CheY-like chemotaxis protein